VVCRHEPTGKETALIFVFVAVNGCICHDCLLLAAKKGERIRPVTF